MSEPVLLFLGVIVGSVIGPLVLALINRLFAKPRDDAALVGDIQSIAQKAIRDLKEERESNAAEIKQLTDRLAAVEAANHGPFRLTLEFTTSPLSIIVQRLEVVEPTTK